MQFWGVEVKPGQTVSCDAGKECVLHISQVALGETKKGSENVILSVKIDDKKMVLGTLSAEKHPQILYDLIFEKEFELSHNSKTASVFLCGYKTLVPDPFESDSGEDEDEEEQTNKNPLGNNIFDKTEGKAPVKVGKMDKHDVEGKAPVKVGKMDKLDDDSDEDETDDSYDDLDLPDDDDDDDMSEDESSGNEDDSSDAMDESDEEDEETLKKPESEDGSSREEDDSSDESEDESSSEEDDSSEDESSRDEDDSSDESEDESRGKEDDSSDEGEEKAPKKPDIGKKRVPETLKTPASDKKAKIATPSGQKTGDKKGAHVATPHPAKHARKTPANKKSPKSAGGSHACESCTKTCGSDAALQSHQKAKHNAAK